MDVKTYIIVLSGGIMFGFILGVTSFKYIQSIWDKIKDRFN